MVLVRSQGCILFSLYHVEDLDGQAKGNGGHLSAKSDGQKRGLHKSILLLFRPWEVL